MLTCGGSVSLSVATLNVDESTAGASATATLTITLSGADCGGESATVVYNTTAGTATSNVDYTATNGTATLSTGATSVQIHIPITHDLIDEPNETFSVGLSSPSNTSLASGSSTTTVTIVDDDAAPLVQFGNALVTATEGAAGTATLQIPVSLYSPTGTVAVVAGTAVTVGYAITPGSASTPADYDGTLSGNVTITAGAGSTNISIDIKGDTIDELDETFTITLSSPTNATLGVASVATVVILDDDGTDPITPSGPNKYRDAHGLQAACSECSESLLFSSNVEMFFGSFEISSRMLFSSTSSTESVDISSFTLPIYESTTMGQATIDFTYTLPNTTNVPVPLQYSVDVTLNDAAGSPLATLPTVYYTTSGASLATGDQIVFAVQLDPTTTPATGYYTYDAKITSHYTSSTASTESSGSLIIVNRRSSEFGAGWSIDGLDRVYQYSNIGMALVRGDGSTAWFPFYNVDGATTTYTASQPGYFVSATAHSGTSLVTLVTKFHEKFEFDNSTGRLLHSYDAAGNATTYHYNGGGFVDYIEDPFQRRSTYAYDGSSKLNTVTDFAGRVVDVDITSGKLTKFTFPDPAGADPAPEFDLDYYPTTSTRYDGLLRYVDVDAKNDPDSGSTPQRRMEILYHAIGELSEVRNPDYSGTNLSSWKVETANYDKLYYLIQGSGKGLSSGNPASVVRLSSIDAKHTDELGMVTTYQFDASGHSTTVARVLDVSTTITTTTHRDASGLIDYIDETDPDGGGPLSTLRTSFTYDGRGNLLTLTHPDSTVLTWQYDTLDSGSVSRFGVPTKLIDEEGHDTRYALNSTTGVIESITRVVGDDGYGGSNDVVTAYTYTDGTGATASLPKGLVLTVTQDVTDSTTVRTDYAYFTSANSKFGRIASITRDAGNATEALRIVESFDYDSNGFLSAYVDGEARRTEFTNDELGRLLKITQPYPDATVYGESDNALGSTYYTESGSTWSSVGSSGYGSSYRRLTAGAGAGYAQWNFLDLVPGTTYEVYATWVGQTTGAATNAHFSSTGATQNINSSTNDQNIDSPEEDPFDDATKWKLLGTVVVTGTTFSVKLDQNSGGVVVADAVRIVKARPITTMTYNAVGDLLTATDPLGNTTKYIHDVMSRTVKVTEADPDGGAATYPVTTLTYDLAGNVRTVTDPVGAVSEYQYDAFQRLTKTLAPYPAAQGGLIVDDQATTGNGFTISGGGWTGTSGYDSDGRYANGGSGANAAAWTFTDLTANKPYEVLITWAENASNSTISPFTVYNGTTAGTALATVSVDQQAAPPEVPVLATALGNKWRSLGTFIPTGTQLTVRLSDTGTGSSRVVADAVRIEPRSVTTYTYDKADNVDTITDPLGNVTDYDYDNRHRTIKITQPPESGGGTSPVSQFGYYKDSQLRFAADPLNRTTRYEYDKYLGQLTRSFAPHPVITDPTMKEVDDANPEAGGFDIVTGSWINSSTGGYGAGTPDYQSILGGGTGVSVKWSFNGLTASSDYEVFVTWKVLSDNDKSATYNVSYGSTDSLSLDQSVEPADGNLFNDSPATKWQSLGKVFSLGGGQTTLDVTLIGDSNGAVRVVADAVRVVKRAPMHSYSYDQAGNLQTDTDPRGKVTDYDYDNFFRLTHRTDPDPGAPAAPETAYTYDKAGNLKSLLDPVGNLTEFDYDGLNRVITETIDLGGDKTRTFNYDAVGNLLRRTDRNERRTDYVYDALYRLTTENWLDGAGSVDHTISYAYDLAGRLTAGDDNDVDSHYDYTYDGASNVTNVAGDNFNHTFSLDSLFDRNNRRTSLASTIGARKDFKNTYSYDNLNRLKQLDQQEQSGTYNHVAEKRVDFTYNLAGQFDTITRYKALAGGTSNDVAKSTYGYDRMGRLTDLLHQDVDVVSSPTTIVDYDWVFDPASRITQFVSSLDGTMEYTYDETNQLTGENMADDDYDRSYAYDENGNRTTGYSTGDYNRVASSPTHTFGYDDEGNQTARTNKDTGVREVMDWDYRNRLSSITTNVPREVAHWRFDGNTENATGDADLDGTLVNGPTYDDADPVGAAFNDYLVLDGVDDYVSLGDDDEFKIRTRNFSISAWFNPEDGENRAMTIVEQGNPVNNPGTGYRIMYRGDTSPPKMEFLLNNSGTGGAQSLTMNYTNGLAGAWHHVVVTITNTSGGALKMYVDGTEVDSDNNAKNGDLQGGVLQVASQGGGTPGYFERYIDDVRIWHEVLAPADVTALYTSTTADALYEPSKVVAYDYDPFDRRIRKQINTDGTGGFEETNEYVYDGQDIVVALDGSGNVKNRYLHGPAVDMILADEQYGAASHTDPTAQEGIVYWPLADHLGTVRDLVDSTGATVNHIRYDGFGNIASETPNAPSHIYGFTGRERDDESHLQYNRARYYDAAIGSWVSEDPLGFAAGDENLRRYVGNQPITNSDPSGLATWQDKLHQEVKDMKDSLHGLPGDLQLGTEEQLNKLDELIEKAPDDISTLILQSALINRFEQHGVHINARFVNGKVVGSFEYCLPSGGKIQGQFSGDENFSFSAKGSNSTSQYEAHGGKEEGSYYIGGSYQYGSWPPIFGERYSGPLGSGITSGLGIATPNAVVIPYVSIPDGSKPDYGLQLVIPFDSMVPRNSAMIPELREMLDGLSAPYRNRNYRLSPRRN